VPIARSGLQRFSHFALPPDSPTTKTGGWRPAKALEAAPTAPAEPSTGTDAHLPAQAVPGGGGGRHGGCSTAEITSGQAAGLRGKRCTPRWAASGGTGADKKMSRWGRLQGLDRTADGYVRGCRSPSRSHAGWQGFAQADFLRLGPSPQPPPQGRAEPSHRRLDRAALNPGLAHRAPVGPGLRDSRAIPRPLATRSSMRTAC